MKISDIISLLPMIITAGTSVVVMMVIAFYRNHKLTVALTLAGLAKAILALFLVIPHGTGRVTPLLIIDGYSLFYMGLILAAGFAVTLFSYDYLERRKGEKEEYYILLLLAVLGCLTLAAAGHFASFFIGLEILSVSLYALIAYQKGRERALEAGFKYLVLAAVSAAFLLFGMALVYAEFGVMEFSQIALKVRDLNAPGIVMLSGLAMMAVGIGFKLAVVPFHLWTPDVYEGAPAPVTAFVATASKGAIFALLFRFFSLMDIHAFGPVETAFTFMAVVSMFAGNLLALKQDNLKRLLAYSSIAHLGYLLVALLAQKGMASTSAAYYLAAYFVSTLGAFGVITVMSNSDRELENIGDYRGLAWERPWLAFVFCAMLFSLAGLPLTAGFLGKFYLAAAGVESAVWLPVMSLVLSSSIGLFYYLRVVIVMFDRVERVRPERSNVPLAGSVALGVLTLLLILLGVWPNVLGALLTVLT